MRVDMVDSLRARANFEFAPEVWRMGTRKSYVWKGCMDHVHMQILCPELT